MSLRDSSADINAIRKVLTADWDPIGCGVPDDEYDSYIPGIHRLIQQEVVPDVLARHLDEIVSDSMGLRADHDRNIAVASLLLKVTH
jgi:hypothetical protein